MERLLKAAFFAAYLIMVVIAMRLVSVFPDPWNIVAQIAIMILSVYMAIDDDSEKKKEEKK